MTNELPNGQRLPSPAAERMRLHRERLRNGLTHLAIDLRRSEVDGLVRLEFLSAETRNDVNAIRTALYEFFERTLDSTT
jgi:hypothetical protein